MSTLAQSITQAATDMALGRSNKSLTFLLMNDFLAGLRVACISPPFILFILLVHESLVTGYRYYLTVQSLNFLVFVWTFASCYIFQHVSFPATFHCYL